ncbi:hypothetical protein ACTJIJ_08280 [Niabella sp. 22666]|uniref:hypothetical protein n=1 Tax=Niabella sp. 22666 TaxID=3453954 RepID=UPI003F875B6F
MTANFSFKRLFLLITKQWIENRRLYLMSALALMGILGAAFALWLLMAGTRYEETSMYIMGMIGLFITGAIFASTSFNMLNSKDTGIYWISFPASHLEKFLVTIFLNVVVFTGVYMSCFYLLKFLAEIYIETRSMSYAKVNWSLSQEFTKAIPVFFSFFFVVQAAFLLGSASFKRFSFIRTIILLMALIFIYGWVSFKVAEMSFPRGFSFNLTRLTTMHENNVYKEYLLPGYIKAPVELFFKFFFAPCIWMITWFKLREKEI